jgi:hypothetical protein
MPNKIDELFAPERLRNNWQKKEKTAEAPASDTKKSESPLSIFADLQEFIRESFSGEDAEVLMMLSEELHGLLAHIFQDSEDSANNSIQPEQARDMAKIIPAGHDILNRIEDIAEAFEMAGRMRHNR